MTLAIAGEGRNAWSALMVRRPGDANWQYASVLRARIERTMRPPQVLVPPLIHAQWRAQPQPQAITQADSLATAARCMSDALRSAMAVVDRMNAQAAQQQDERRRGRCRRESDRHPDDIAFE
ncbi:hypothetical protein INH39_20865 [Massilia violaceinigra]|uniref:KfrA N-terminal DNA-binding domain-containing protein n=1 Tax=Massilia violaceinigra TaxID=2045208 RepID=A0ABY4A1H9_9BURK|nr:hypothetical protein [Massilia violaceinigra]UOD27924.1 hypothetical protein INH39_20865 [Massilia violaceinigra]